jgi:hypothetical protein
MKGIEHDFFGNLTDESQTRRLEYKHDLLWRGSCFLVPPAVSTSLLAFVSVF